jgi:hypothetical protein
MLYYYFVFESFKKCYTNVGLILLLSVNWFVKEINSQTDSSHWSCCVCCSSIGQSIDLLDYDAIQDMSLLLGSADHRGSALRRFARFLGVHPQILAHLHSFPDLFHYLRASTYILLPQLAQAAALLPCPWVVARIHQAVMNKWTVQQPQ